MRSNQDSHDSHDECKTPYYHPIRAREKVMGENSSIVTIVTAESIRRTPDRSSHFSAAMPVTVAQVILTCTTSLQQPMTYRIASCRRLAVTSGVTQPTLFTPRSLGTDRTTQPSHAPDFNRPRVVGPAHPTAPTRTAHQPRSGGCTAARKPVAPVERARSHLRNPRAMYDPQNIILATEGGKQQ